MEILKLIREHKNLTQLEVAKIAGSTATRIKNAEGAGNPPSLSLIKSIAKGLKVQAWQIFYLEEHPELWNEEGVKQVLEME